MHCELVLPSVLASPARATSLELLVARGRGSKAAPRSLECWLQQEFGLEGRLPAGALSWLGAGGNPADSVWVRADPVHMQVMRDRVVLSPAGAFAVSREDAAALCDAVTRHFTGAVELHA